MIPVRRGDATGAPSPRPETDGAVSLSLAGPVQVHVHLGHAVPAPSPALVPKRGVLVPGLLAFSLLGAGYLVGLRAGGESVAPPAGAASLPAPPVLGPVPPAVGPAALLRELDRPPTVAPPPGVAAAGAPRIDGGPAGGDPFGFGR